MMTSELEGICLMVGYDRIMSSLRHRGTSKAENKKPQALRPPPTGIKEERQQDAMYAPWGLHTQEQCAARIHNA
eukprot:1144078-Pelagomonas_calceolata.AAC.4